MSVPNNLDEKSVEDARKSLLEHYTCKTNNSITTLLSLAIIALTAVLTISQLNNFIGGWIGFIGGFIGESWVNVIWYVWWIVALSIIIILGYFIFRAFTRIVLWAQFTNAIMYVQIWDINRVAVESNKGAGSGNPPIIEHNSILGFQPIIEYNSLLGLHYACCEFIKHAINHEKNLKSSILRLTRTLKNFDP